MRELARRERQHRGKPIDQARSLLRRARDALQNLHEGSQQRRRCAAPARNGADRVAPPRGGCASRDPSTAADTSPRYGRGHDRRDACNARPRACRHARQTGKAAVDMRDNVGGRGPALLEHFLDQVDAPARAVEFVAFEHIGRTGRGTEAAMTHDRRIFSETAIWLSSSCASVKTVCMDQIPAYMRPVSRTPSGSKLDLISFVSSCSGGESGSNTSTRLRTPSGARTKVAWPIV